MESWMGVKWESCRWLLPLMTMTMTMMVAPPPDSTTAENYVHLTLLFDN